MAYKKFKFKSNITCGGCVAKVSPFTDMLSKEYLQSWKVDFQSADKIVEAEISGTPDAFIEKVKEAGYNIELKKGLLGF